MGLRNRFEEAVWAAAFTKCFPAGASRVLLQHAVECADTTVLQLRKFAIDNERCPGTPHILDMDQHITDEGELDLDSE